MRPRVIAPPIRDAGCRILEAAKRAEVMQKFQEMLQKDGPMAPPILAGAFTFMVKKMLGFETHPASGYILRNRLALAA